MATEYRVVFAGEVLEGYTSDAVKETAAHRLKVTPEQLVRLFSGKPVVLKKGLEIATAEQYVAELNRIGMKVRVEPVPDHAAAPHKVESYAPPAAPVAQAPSSPFPSLALVDDTPAPAAQARANLANAPTYVVPREQIDATRQRLEQALAAQNDPALAPTVIVSPAQAAEARRAAATAADMPTVVIPHASNSPNPLAVMAEGTAHLNKAPTKNKEAERTLIADEDALQAYLSSSGGADPIGLLDPAGPALEPVMPPSTPPLAPSPAPSLELKMEEAVPATALPPEIPLPPPIPEIPAIPTIPENPLAAEPGQPQFPESLAVPPPLPPVPPAQPLPTQTRRPLPKTLPQEAAILAGKPAERETPPPPARGLATPIKILLGIVAFVAIGGLGLLLWLWLFVGV